MTRLRLAGWGGLLFAAWQGRAEELFGWGLTAVGMAVAASGIVRALDEL